jgi:ATP-dependent RNA helicase DDX23/PRP28
MGATKRQVRRTGDKKFSFDWSIDEDTTVDEIYNHSRSIQPMFGRGTIAGVEGKNLAAGGASRQPATESKSRWADVNWREKPLQAMTERDWRILREDFSISTKGGNIPRPIRSWNEAPIPDELKDIIDDIGYVEPTPIQRQSIPIGLENRDLIGIAQTGSGKTAAFLIPLLVFIMKMPRLTKVRFADGPYALIMAPTRELAIQIETEAKKFAQPLGFRCVSLVGGHSLEEQSLALDRGAEIIIGTPGRLKDVLDRRILVLNQCCYLVMDEADRMMDMGFEQDVNYVLSALPVSNQKPDTDDAEQTDKIMKDGLPLYRQTTMFSATMPASVEKIVKQYLRRPAAITIGETGKAVDTVEQRVEMIGEDKKQDRIVSLLQRWDPPIIIFVNLKSTCDTLSRLLGKAGYRVATLHGGKSQDMREFALQELRSGKKDILVATGKPLSSIIC